MSKSFGPVRSLGAFIARRRSELNLTQSEVAAAIGVQSPDFISLVETERRNLGMDRVPRLAEILKVDARELCLMAMAEQYPMVADVLSGDTALPKLRPFTAEDELVRMLRKLDGSARSTVKALVEQLYRRSHRQRLGEAA